MPFLEQHTLPNQFGLQSKKSAEDAISMLTTKMYSNSDSGNPSGASGSDKINF